MIRTTSRGLKLQYQLFEKALKTTSTTALSIPVHQRCQSSTSERKVPQVDLKKFCYLTPEEGYVRTSPYAPIEVPDLTIDKYVWGNIQKWENKIATQCVVTGRKYTYAKLRDCSAALALRLQQKFHFKPRDVAAVCLPNIPEYPIAVLGAFEAGLTISPMNPAYTAEDFARQLTISGAKFIFATVENYNIVKSACNAIKKDIPICCIRISNDSGPLPQGTIDFFQLIETQGVSFIDIKSHGIEKTDLAFLPFSSGTTGLPKGVQLTHENITSNCEMMNTDDPFPELVHKTTENFQEILPCFLPFFHIYGLTICMLVKLRGGCQLTTMPKFTPDDFLKSITEYKATILHLVPPILLFMTNTPKLDKDIARNVRMLMTGAAPIGAKDVEKFLTKFPHIEIMQGYGLTETSPVTLMTQTGNKKYAAAGFVVPSSEGKVVAFDDPTATGLGPHEVGELCFRGPHVMKGYINNEEANRNTFYPNKWLRSGDVGYYDEEGYFYVTDRMKELIKVKGFQVPPAELEEILRAHPKVLDAAVIGIPNEKCGEVPRAVIVLRKDVKATEEEIKEHVASHVIEYKRLEGGVTFTNEIPKNASGKILRRELKAKYS